MQQRIIYHFNNLKRIKLKLNLKKSIDIIDDAKEHAEHIGIIQDK
jgi:hypothetical protein